ncbi:MAG: ABC transporter permease [Hyphomicrobiaceae bacterium]
MDTMDRLITPPSRLQRLWQNSQDVVIPLASLLLLVAMWEFSVWLFAIRPFLLPAPSRIFKELVNVAPHLPMNIGATLLTILLGFFTSVFVSIPLAIAIASSATVARGVYPILLITQSTPMIAIAPILVVIMGTGQLSRTTVAFLIAFFPLLISTVTGLLATPREIVDLSRMMRTSFFQDLWLIRLPNAVPFIFAGLKVAISLSVIGAVVSEFVTANAGLGYLITQSTAFFNVPLAFGAVILLATLGVSLFGLINLVQRVFFPWSVESAARS